MSAAAYEFKQLVRSQFLMVYAYNGGISYEDTNQMTPEEFKLGLSTFDEILKSQRSK